MLSAIFLLSVIWFGFVTDEEFSLSQGDFLVRLGAAIVLGCFWGSWIVFLLAWAFGFSVDTVAIGTALMLALNALAYRFRQRNARWFASLLVFDRKFWKASVVPTVLITAYFAVCVWTDPDGNIWFRGNTRDLAFHMSTASAFLEQTTFPPLNPQSAAAKLSYHFMADFFSAILCRGGFSLFYAFKIPMVLLAFALCSLTFHGLFSVLKSRTATTFAGLLFFFGHVGVVNLLFSLAGYPVGSVPLSLHSWSSFADHIAYPYYNFLNVVIDYFQPQLPFLFGFPLAMLVLTVLYRRFSGQTPTDRTTYLLLGVVAFLPLFHMHTFLTIGPLVGLVVLFEPAPPWRAATGRDGFVARLIRMTISDGTPLPSAAKPASAEKPLPSGSEFPPSHAPLKIIAMLLAGVVVGLQLGFILSQEKTRGFSGFDVAKQLGALPEIPRFLHLQRCWFWVRAGGVPLVLGLIAVLISFRLPPREAKSGRRGEIALLALLGVTGFFFLVINVYRFTPNWGDSNKFFLYFDLALCIYSGRLLAFLWQGSRSWRIVAGLLVSVGAVVPTASEWIGRYGREPERLFSAGDRLVAEWIRLNTQKDAVFLTANSTVHLVPAFAGRRVVNGSYTRETGFGDEATEALVARAYREADPALITKCKVTHIFVGPAEEGLYHVDRATMGRRFKTSFDQDCLGVRYSIYEVGEQSAEAIRRDREVETSRPAVWLSELSPTSVQQGYGTLKIDKSFDLTTLSLAKQTYPFGLGTHAPSEITFNLDRHYAVFESDLGVDDTQLGGIGTVVFEVWVDDRKVYESKVMRAGDPPDSIKIDVSDVTTLKLVVTDAGDGIHCDHADWAGAKLLRSK
jgi:hypothetical protein